ncbi:MAG TPA: RDD family protein [Terriglobales bacterium]|nr:RDD family protein [Terriglobales bacterium]
MPTQYVAAPAVRYGGFWIRFVAVIIDALIMGIVVWPVAGILGLMVGVAGGSVQMPDVGIHLVRGVVAGALFLFAGWIYEASLESSSKQATVGKMALGLKVTDEQGRRISFGRATARYFSKILSRMTLMIGYIMAGFTARKQALHDLIAGTLVVRSL